MLGWTNLLQEKNMATRMLKNIWVKLTVLFRDFSPVVRLQLSVYFLSVVFLRGHVTL